MSRNDRRHGDRKSWSSRENNERNRNERNDRNDRSPERSERGERSGKRHESRGRGAYERRQERRRAMGQNSEEIRQNESAIRAFKENIVKCEICGETITDIATAINNRGSGKPVHFDCVINKIAETEKPSPTEKIAYIGQGKFAVLYFENPHDTRKFSIRRTIEWEERDSARGELRDEMAGLFSQVK